MHEALVKIHDGAIPSSEALFVDSKSRATFPLLALGGDWPFCQPARGHYSFFDLALLKIVKFSCWRLLYGSEVTHRLSWSGQMRALLTFIGVFAIEDRVLIFHGDLPLVKVVVVIARVAEGLLLQPHGCPDHGLKRRLKLS